MLKLTVRNRPQIFLMALHALAEAVLTHALQREPFQIQFRHYELRVVPESRPIERPGRRSRKL